MTHSSRLQYLAVLSAALLLLFLFSESQLDNRQHSDNIISLLAFLEYDSQIKQQVVELKHGHRKNYHELEAITRSQQNLVNGFNGFEYVRSNETLSSINDGISNLRQQVTSRNEDIEIFKRGNTQQQ